MVQKRAKLAFMGKNFEVVPVPKQGGTGTTIQKPISTGTDTSGTGTTIQNVYGTDTEQRGTSTTLPKNAQIFIISYI